MLLFVASIFALGLSSNARAETLDCAMAAKIARHALTRHLTQQKMSRGLSTRMIERFTQTLIEEYGIAFDEDDIKQLRKWAGKLSHSGTGKAFMEGHCDAFEDQARWARARLAAYRLRLGSADQLRALLTLRNSRLAEFPWILRELDFWTNDEEIPIQDAARFVAARHFDWLDQLLLEDSSATYSLLLHAFAKALDSQSNYIPETESRGYRDRYRSVVSGLGIEAEPHPYGMRITRVLALSPAARDGRILRNQILTQIDGKKTLGQSEEALTRSLEGPAGGTAQLTLAEINPYGGFTESFAVRLARDQVNRNTVKIRATRATVDNKNIVTLSLEDFYDHAAADLAAELLKAKSEGRIDALILDLRDNPGGLLTEARHIIGLFVGQNRTAIGSKNRTGELDRSNTGLTAQMYDGPLVIAINQGSASASELVAGTLKDYKRALIVGSPHSYGKGTMQGFFDSQNVPGMPGIFKITEDQFYSVGGDSIQCKGVISHVTVPGPLGLEENERECEGGVMYPISHDTLQHPVWETQDYRATLSSRLPSAISAVREAAQKRGTATATPETAMAPLTYESQLQQIFQIAADLASLISI